MIKIRIEGSLQELDKIIDHLLEHFDEAELSGSYELSRKKARVYMDIKV